MTLKKELEILRGEPIQVFTGDPMDIPCIETSDPEKLCKHPVVSVHMITYNHELYIRQAIEGVMMQKTDFEFELVIGEDASTDKTREICFEYQKKYPDKIRVLWWHENLYRNPHTAGGNSKRNMAHCRGEFIAFCEGDDYWTNPRKLQMQVDILRTHPDIKLVCGNYSREVDGKIGCLAQPEPDRVASYFQDGLRMGVLFVRTLTVMLDRKCLVEYLQSNELAKCFLRVGDYAYWLAMTEKHDKVYYIGEPLGVYRFHPGGITYDPVQFLRLEGDCSVIRYMFMVHSGLFPRGKAMRIAQYIYAYRRIYCEERRMVSDDDTVGRFRKSLLDVSEEDPDVKNWLLPFYQAALKFSCGYPSYRMLCSFFRKNGFDWYAPPVEGRALKALLLFLPFPLAYRLYRCWAEFRVRVGLVR